MLIEYQGKKPLPVLPGAGYRPLKAGAVFLALQEGFLSIHFCSDSWVVTKINSVWR